MLRIPAHFGEQNNPPEPDTRLKVNFSQQNGFQRKILLSGKTLAPALSNMPLLGQKVLILLTKFFKNTKYSEHSIRKVSKEK
jgi:hypothetical protein